NSSAPRPGLQQKLASAPERCNVPSRSLQRGGGGSTTPSPKGRSAVRRSHALRLIIKVHSFTPRPARRLRRRRRQHSTRMSRNALPSNNAPKISWHARSGSSHNALSANSTSLRTPSSPQQSLLPLSSSPL